MSLKKSVDTRSRFSISLLELRREVERFLLPTFDALSGGVGNRADDDLAFEGSEND